MDQKEKEALEARFKASLADGKPFTFMIGCTQQIVTRVGVAHDTDGPLLMVIGVPLGKVCEQVSAEGRARLKALPLLKLPEAFEGILVEVWSDE